MPPKVAAALQALGTCEARHLISYLPRGTLDEDVFAFAAQEGWLLLTQDSKIRKKPHERAALLQAGIGAFILTSRANRSIEEMMVFLLSRLPEMKQLAEASEPPFIFAVPDRGSIQRLD